jgi:hypothetical protein
LDSFFPEHVVGVSDISVHPEISMFLFGVFLQWAFHIATIPLATLVPDKKKT